MSIQKRGRSYYVRYRRDGQHFGRSFARKEDAEAFELEMKRAKQLGAHAPSVPSRDTLDQWLDTWWALQSPTWAEATRVQRKHTLDKWVRPVIGRVRLYDLGTKRVAEWRSAIIAKGASASVVNHAQAVLSAALGHAVRLGDLPANPCRVLEKLPTVADRPRALTPNEVERVTAVMVSERDRILTYLQAYAGLRPGEALALTWDDVSDALIVVDKSWSYRKLKRTKTEKMRTVEIVAPLARDLAAYRPAAAERGALVVPNAAGGYLEINNWRNREWAKAIEKAGVQATPYDLRHTYASLLIHEGRSVPAVAALMGHSRPSTTLDTYSHVYAEARLQKAVEMVDAIEQARRGVLKTCSPAPVKRLRQSAPGA
jgi:integrase